jgi:hypothetical protein
MTAALRVRSVLLGAMILGGICISTGAQVIQPPTNLRVDGVLSLSKNAGVFLTRAELDRAKQRMTSTTQPFRDSYNVQRSNADTALNTTPNPFYMERTDYLSNFKYAWRWSSCPDTDSVDNSLTDAVTKLETQGNYTRSLALQYALTGDVRYADKAKQYLLAWAARSTPVNMYDFYKNTTTWDGGLTGGNESDTCFRPYNLALDGMFQGYGLINFADAYALLTNNGYTLTASENQQIRTYLYVLTAAVNSSYHAWMRWADAHNCVPKSDPNDSCTRFRKDNHLSWGQAPILAAAAALGDQAIADYVLKGTAWNDGRSGLVTNSSPVKYVINQSILSTGQIYDEAPSSVGGIGRANYAFYHLWALEIIARIDDIHFSQGIWDYKGGDGMGLKEAYAAERVRGTSWQYEFVYNRWPESAFASGRGTTGERAAFIMQSYGPVAFLFGQ